MSSLIITKETGNLFSLVLDGGTPIRSDQNRLTTKGNFCDFKTANGANIIQKQNILFSEVTLIASGTFTFASVTELWVKLDEVGFFDGLATGAGGGVDEFVELLDTFPSYLGRDGQVLIVNESEQKIDTQAVSLFSAADKAKLDGIETGAQVNVTPDFNITNPATPGYIANKPDFTIGTIYSIDFARLEAPQSDFEIPENTVAKWALVNGTVYVPLSANNVAEFNTFTQDVNVVTFTNELSINEYPVIFYQ